MVEEIAETPALAPAFWEGRAKHRDDLAFAAENDGLPDIAAEHRRAAERYREQARRCLQ
jgi:hypothetical protein